MRRCATGLLALAVVGTVACTPARVRYEEALEATPPGAEHAVHGARLRELMSGLERLVHERLPRAMDTAEPVEQRRREIAAVARAMAAAAAAIPSAAEEDLTAEARERFRTLAADLEQSAAALGRGAADLPLEALRARVGSIEATCSGCHERFRLSGGPGAG